MWAPDQQAGSNRQQCVSGCSCIMSVLRCWLCVCMQQLGFTTWHQAGAAERIPPTPLYHHLQHRHVYTVCRVRRPPSGVHGGCVASECFGQSGAAAVRGSQGLQQGKAHPVAPSCLVGWLLQQRRGRQLTLWPTQGSWPFSSSCGKLQALLVPAASQQTVKMLRCMACCLWACGHKGHPGGRACHLTCHPGVMCGNMRGTGPLPLLRCKPTQWHYSNAEHASHLATPTPGPLHSKASKQSFGGI